MADTAPAPAPAPASLETTALPWTCNNLNIEDPVGIKFWPPFHKSKAGSFGTAIDILIASMVLIILLVISQALISNQGYRRNSTIAIFFFAFVGIFLCAGFSVLGLQYTNPAWESETSTDKPGIFDSPKHDKVLVDGKEVEQCESIMHKPWVWIVGAPGVILLISIVVMVIAKRRKANGDGAGDSTMTTE